MSGSPHGGYGWKQSLPDHRDLAFAPDTAGRLPAKTSLRNSPCLPPVYDQGQLGSCVSQGVAGIYEFDLRKQGKPDIQPSRLDIYYEGRVIEGTVDQDSGLEVRDGLKAAAKPGVCPESEWPYDINTFQGPPPAGVQPVSHAVRYYAINLGAGAPLRACLAAGYPFTFGFNVPAAFESRAMADGSDPLLRLPGPNDGFVGGHCVVAVGYDFSCSRFPVPVFEIRNSWGEGWGDQGHCFFDYRCFSTICSDIWTIRSTS